MYKKLNWNKAWETEKKNDYWKKPDPDLVEFIKNLPKNVISVLDLGSGLGRHSLFCAKQGLHVTAIDLSGKAIGALIEWAGEEKAPVTAFTGDIFSDKIRDQRFDLIISINVIYHATRNEIVRTIKGIYEKLCESGLFYLSFLTRDDDKYGVGKEVEPHTFLCDTSLHKGDIHYFADENDLKDLLKDFVIISLKKDEHEWEYEGEKRYSSFWKAGCRALVKPEV